MTEQWVQERQRQGIESDQVGLLSELKNPEYAVKYLTACFEESREVFNLAVKDVKDKINEAETKEDKQRRLDNLRITLLKRYRTLLKDPESSLDSIEAIYEAFGGLPEIVPRDSIHKTDKHLPGEVFASELLTQPISLKREESGSILVTIDRNEVSDAVITNAGKKELRRAYVSERRTELKNKEIEIQDFLVGNSNEESIEEKSIKPNKIHIFD